MQKLHQCRESCFHLNFKYLSFEANLQDDVTHMNLFFGNSNQIIIVNKFTFPILLKILFRVFTNVFFMETLSKLKLSKHECISVCLHNIKTNEWKKVVRRIPAILNN